MTKSELVLHANVIIEQNRKFIELYSPFTLDDDEITIKDETFDRTALSVMLWKLILSEGLSDEERVYLIGLMYYKEELYKDTPREEFLREFGMNRSRYGKLLAPIKRKLQILWILYYS